MSGSGLENGENLLAPYFPEIQMRRYEDAIEIAEAEPLISYILSCHGNQNQLHFEPVQRVPGICFCPRGRWFHITKDAGIFHVQKIVKKIYKKDLEGDLASPFIMETNTGIVNAHRRKCS